MSTPTTVKAIKPHLEQLALAAVTRVFKDAGASTDTLEVALSAPPKTDMGDLGFPCFPWRKALGGTHPVQIATKVVEAFQALAADDPIVASINNTGPFVNVRINFPGVLEVAIDELAKDPAGFGGGQLGEDGQRIMLEFSSPNTNKPQHLGHVRNNLIGETTANIMAHVGHNVVRTNLINDRGIHICKSMLAYKLHGDGATPESTGKKGDHLVGDYYVKFNALLSAEYEAWLASDAAVEGVNQDKYFNTHSSIGAQTRALLEQWEAGDPEVRALWKMMNGWVEAGFEETYARLGVHFDRIDHESETYLLGKDLVEKGYEDGVFEKADNGAIVFDLEKIGLSGQKALLRPNGTSLYTTQDLGTARKRFDEDEIDQLIYVVGNEQNYHFQVLFGILTTLDPSLDGRCHHLTYGMVNLEHGRMKSREGTVVDADDLMDEMTRLATEGMVERNAELKALGNLDELLTEEEIAQRAPLIGMAALKFYILNVSPPTTMKFIPETSVRFLGETGPYCMYAYARSGSILRKAGFDIDNPPPGSPEGLAALGTDLERDVIRRIMEFPSMVEWAARKHDPSKVAAATYKLSQAVSAFFNDSDHIVLTSPEPLKTGRLNLMYAANRVIKAGLALLTIEPLERM